MTIRGLEEGQFFLLGLPGKPGPKRAVLIRVLPPSTPTSGGGGGAGVALGGHGVAELSDAEPLQISSAKAAVVDSEDAVLEARLLGGAAKLAAAKLHVVFSHFLPCLSPEAVAAGDRASLAPSGGEGDFCPPNLWRVAPALSGHPPLPPPAVFQSNRTIGDEVRECFLFLFT